MRLNQIFCFHNYKKLVTRSGFYGERSLHECSKCKRQKITQSGFPEYNDHSKTKVTHYD